MAHEDRKRDPNHSDDDVALKREPALERLRDEIQVARDNLPLAADNNIVSSLDDLADEIDDVIGKQSGPSKKERDEQTEREEELKKPQ
jgi:hypothetical protein